MPGSWGDRSNLNPNASTSFPVWTGRDEPALDTALLKTNGDAGAGVGAGTPSCEKSRRPSSASKIGNVDRTTTTGRHDRPLTEANLCTVEPS